MTEMIVKEREFVVPGDEIIKSMDYLPGRNCFREGDSIFSRTIGVVSLSGRVVSVIPLNSVYVPKGGDMVIARIIDIQSNGWVLDIKSIYDAFLPLAGVREYIDTNTTKLSSVMDVGDMLYGKIRMVSGDSIYITMQDPMARNLKGGQIIEMNSAKVPRVIGKKGSMVNMIKNKTGTRINIGQNGLVWLEGGDVDLVIKTIRLIEAESHKSGLTERVAKELGVEPPVREEAPRQAPAERPAEVPKTEPPKEEPAEKPPEEKKEGE